MDAVVAARRRGLTLGPWEAVCVVVGGATEEEERPVACPWGWGWWRGVLAPVATGVERFEGSSEMNMVALEGEMRYLAVRVERRASLKPVLSEKECSGVLV